MHPALVVMIVVGFAGGSTGIVATVMADLAAHSQRQSGLVKAKDPEVIWLSAVRPAAMFTDWYKIYHFGFIRRCVYVARGGFIVAIFAPLALLIDWIAGR